LGLTGDEGAIRHVGGIPLRADMVAAFLLDSKAPGQTLLLQRRRDDKYAPGGFQMLYGHIEPGEYPEQTLAREIAEETGLKIEKFYSLNETLTFYDKVSRTIRMTPVFVAYLRTDTPLRLDETEHCAAEWVSFGEAGRRLPWKAQREALSGLRELLSDDEGLPEIMRLEVPC